MAKFASSKKVFYSKKASRREKGLVLIIVITLVSSISIMVSYINLKNKKYIKAQDTNKEKRNIKNFSEELIKKIFILNQKIENKTGEISETIIVKYKNKKYLIELKKENSLFNINNANIDDLYSFLEELELPQEKIDIMSQSIIDWIDKDDEALTNGAENDYYSQKGYRSKNKNIESFQEISLIKGFNSYILWVKPRIFDKITIFQDKELYRMTIKNEDFNYTVIFKIKNNKIEKKFETFL